MFEGGKKDEWIESIMKDVRGLNDDGRDPAGKKKGVWLSTPASKENPSGFGMDPRRRFHNTFQDGGCTRYIKFELLKLICLHRHVYKKAAKLCGWIAYGAYRTFVSLLLWLHTMS